MKPKCLALIAARGGSKRIPRKNMRPFLGKPIIQYSIEAAQEAGCFDTVMVSTDDQEIAAFATAHKAEVPFMRSADAAGDFAPLAAVLEDVLDRYKAQGDTFDYVCCLLATAPFTNAQWLAASLKMVVDAGADGAVPIVRFSYPIDRAFELKDGFVQMRWPEHIQTRSNDLPVSYHDCGLFYWLNVDSFTRHRQFFMPRSIGIELPESHMQDIDTESDWQLAELKYRLLQENGQLKAALGAH